MKTYQKLLLTTAVFASITFGLFCAAGTKYRHVIDKLGLEGVLIFVILIASYIVSDKFANKKSSKILMGITVTFSITMVYLIMSWVSGSINVMVQKTTDHNTYILLGSGFLAGILAALNGVNNLYVGAFARNLIPAGSLIIAAFYGLKMNKYIPGDMNSLITESKFDSLNLYVCIGMAVMGIILYFLSCGRSSFKKENLVTLGNLMAVGAAGLFCTAWMLRI